MDEEERLRRKKKIMMKKKRAKQRQKRFMLLLWAAFMLLLIFLVVSHKKEDTGETSSIVQGDEGFVSVGEAGVDRSSLSQNGAPAPAVDPMAGVDPLSYEGAVDVSLAMNTAVAPDLTEGRAAVDLSAVDGDLQRVASAKRAMASAAWFTGTATTVDSYLRSYGEGSWHAIRDAMGEICVFYQGKHPRQTTITDDEGERTKTVEVPFKVVFTVFEDGSFVVNEAYENGEAPEDLGDWLEGVASLQK